MSITQIKQWWIKTRPAYQVLRFAWSVRDTGLGVVHFMTSAGFLVWLKLTWQQVQSLPGPYRLGAYIVALFAGLMLFAQIVVVLGFLWRFKKQYVEFYSGRDVLGRVAGDLATELESAQEVWAIWATASQEAAGPTLPSGKITRLILLSPNHPHIGELGQMIGFSKDQQKSDVEKATRVFRISKTGEVKWSTMPLTYMIVVDPSQSHGWVRVEDYFSRNGRPSYVVRKREYPELFQEIVNHFNALFESADVPPQV